MATARKTITKTKKAEPVDIPLDIEELEEVEEEVEERKPVSNKLENQNAPKKFAYSVKEQLEKEPKVKIFIPVDEMNPELTIAEINLSGYKYQIPRGEEYEVPKSIYEIWKESYEKTLRAERRIAEAGKMKEPIASL
jgi:hypothetical protein